MLKIRKPKIRSQKVRKADTQKGFTLAETLVSLLLLTIVLMASISFFFNSRTILTGAVQKRMMTQAASSKLEELKKGGYANLPEMATPVSENITVGGISTQQTTRITDMDEDVDGKTDGVTDYKEVKVNMTWQQAGKSKSKTLTMTTFMAP